jgi:hypothetical protein
MVRPITDNMPLAEKEAQAIAEAAYRDYARRSCAARTRPDFLGSLRRLRAGKDYDMMLN